MRPTVLKVSILLLVCLLIASVYLGQTLSPSKNNKAVAVVAGQTIYEDDLLPMVEAQLRQLRTHEYQLKKQALDSLINQKLLETEAKKKGLPTGKLLEQEVDAKVPDPTEAELKAFYASQKDTLKRPFEDLKAQLQQALKQPKIQQARQDYLSGLRQQANVSILLGPPRVEMGYDTGRLRGSSSAPVMIVEFSDFQCPFCQRVQPTLKNLLGKYQGQVSLAYRDFPLREIHPQAQSAAEASRCAGEQGKFWEYHDLLFANPNKLGRDGLLEQARSLKLDEKQFDSCLSSGQHRAKIEQDIQDATRAGITGTPGFFINGIYLNGAQPQSAFEAIIEPELAAHKSKRATP